MSVVAGNPGGFWRRLGAYLLDSIVIGVLMNTFIGLTGNTATGLLMLYFLLLPVFWNGFTVGKYLCGIQIRRVLDKSPPTVRNMILRFFVGSLLYAVTLGIVQIVSGYFVITREDKRSIHDLIAGTEVIRR
ncbi:RDD family protein [Paenibacillus gallinarum]|uniref:RDD family protein n=1 Tax=Paenibacillus gallinarum TaxID=2762232 RepID=A0ABR8STR6_9BACL|nr:RDD family protein [Paenibacillus gallinarum]MBD7966754.1 RDD family protein [Paenibacillus gallinarum]